MAINLPNQTIDLSLWPSAGTIRGDMFSGASPSGMTVVPFGGAHNPFAVKIEFPTIAGCVLYEIQRSTAIDGTYSTFGTNSWRLPELSGYHENFSLSEADRITQSWQPLATVTAIDANRNVGLSASVTYYYRVRGIFANGTTTNWSDIVSGSTPALNSVSPMHVGSGQEFADLAAANAARTAATGGVIILHGTTVSEGIALKGGAGENDRLIVAGMPNEALPYLRGNYSVLGSSGERRETLVIGSGSGGNVGNMFLHNFGVEDCFRVGIRQGFDTTPGAANVHYNAMVFRDVQHNGDNPGAIYLGYQGTVKSANAEVSNCHFQADTPGLKINTWNSLGVRVRYCFFESEDGIHNKYNSQSVDNDHDYSFNNFICPRYGMFGDGRGSRWRHNNVRPHASQTGSYRNRFNENYDGDYQLIEHNTIVGSTRQYIMQSGNGNASFMVVRRNMLAENTNNVSQIVNPGDNQFFPSNHSADFIGGSADLVNYAGGDLTVASGSAAYRAADDGMDYGAFQPGVGMTAAGGAD